MKLATKDILNLGLGLILTFLFLAAFSPIFYQVSSSIQGVN